MFYSDDQTSSAFKPFDNILDKTFKFTSSSIEDILKSLSKNNVSYPPMNVIKFEDGTYRIELAVAGFKKSELSVSLNEAYGVKTLSVSGEKKEKMPLSAYIHNGIANRQFAKDFVLGGFVELGDVELSNGLLSIQLKTRLPTKNNGGQVVDIKESK